jgi:lycopene beta-cyclase
MDLNFNKKIKYYPKNIKHIPIGTAAGAVKPTTGYAFRNMYHHSLEIAKAILNKKPIPAIYRPSRLAFYDSLLIDILVQNPQYGKQIFTQLFKRVKHNIILKFLDEKTSFLEELPILWALPKNIFLRKLWSKIF